METISDFEASWTKRETAAYGRVEAYWIDLDSLLAVKEQIPHPRHQSDADYLRRVKAMRRNQGPR